MQENTDNDLGFMRVAAASPALRVADIEYNLACIEDVIREADEHGIQVLVFPELCLSGYTCADLFFQQLLLERVESAIVRLAQQSSRYHMLILVGAPLELDGKLYNCAVALNRGDIIGVVPKTFIPNTYEFYEERWFSSARDRTEDQIHIGACKVPFGEDL
ncbi:MAG: nitrilase-related carbon-nitrogen hydrolase, partial [Thermodesulfobacteriota bacterium]